MDQPTDEVVAPADGSSALAEQALQRAILAVRDCNKFKAPRLAQIAKYRKLYAGLVAKKYRQPFNVVLPVFAGSMDTLMAGFNDDLSLEYEEQEPADYLAVRKLNALWHMEATSSAPNAKFPLKTRQDRSNAMFSGRGFMMNYATSIPEYRNHFEIFELEDAIFQPEGGGQWANHIYSGRQNVIKSSSDLKSDIYDPAQVKKLLERAHETDFVPENLDDAQRLGLAKFKAMNLQPTENNYVGEQLFTLAEMRITINGTRYYILFSPWYQTWVRFAPFKDIFTADIDPWVSWATHEDNKNFLSKSYADDMYGVADAVHTMFNQEITNREKRNFNPRGYDISFFPDVGKLDQAQYRPDALVPVTVPAGKRIEDGIFSFETPQLQGTISLIDWIQQASGKDIGVTETNMGGNMGVTKRASVVFAEQQAIAKRLLLRSSSYTEAMAEIGRIFFQGAKDHLPAQKAIKRLGIEGEGWDAVIRRTDLDLYSDVDVRAVSSSIEMKNSQLKKEARMKVLSEISANPNPAIASQLNPRWLVEELLRSGGEYDDAEIKIGTDVKNYGNKEEVAYAHQAIQQVLNNEKPDMFYGATTLFMQILIDFASNNRTTLSTKFDTIINHAMAHVAVVQENMARKAQIEASLAASAAPPAGAPAAPGQPAASTPSPMPPAMAPATASASQAAAHLP
jgi:hypothetical protein